MNHRDNKRTKLLQRLQLQHIPSPPIEIRRLAALYSSEPQRLGKRIFEQILREVRAARCALRLERSLRLGLEHGSIITMDQNPGIEAIVTIVPLPDSESRTIEAEEQSIEDNVQRAIEEIDESIPVGDDLLKLDDTKKSSAIDLLNAAISKLVQLRDLLKENVHEENERISSLPPPNSHREEEENGRNLGFLADYMDLTELTKEIEGEINNGVVYEHH